MADLLHCLHWLDTLLEGAVTITPSVYGAEVTQDAFRGLHISPQEAQRLLNREPGNALFGTLQQETPCILPDNLPIPPTFKRLAKTYSLVPFDIAILLIVLAPELDLKYERLYAYLQDDVTKRHPGVDLALNLLCSNGLEKIQCRSHFSNDAPLIRHGLVQLHSDPAQIQPSLLAHYLKLDEQITTYLLDEQHIDKRISSACELSCVDKISGNFPPLNAAQNGLFALAKARKNAGLPLWLHFNGPDNACKVQVAKTLANTIDMPLLYVSLAKLQSAGSDVDTLSRVTVRQAWLKNAVLYLDDYDVLREREQTNARQQWLTQLHQSTGIIILSGLEPWVPQPKGPEGVMSVQFDWPDSSQRRQLWQQALQIQRITLSAEDLNALIGRFRLTSSQISDAAVTASNQAQLRAATYPEQSQLTTLDDLFAAARIQTRHVLSKLAQHIEPKAKWEDLVLPEDAMSQLHEIAAQYQHRQTVYETWGFARKLSYGKGINVLFAGSSGTGKTMAAEILAAKLGLDLFKINLSSVVSKYIGETEKNLDKIFTAAENANVILFFDEADALFGKRSEVKDAHDRYANLEISYLLQKMEQHESITILATNLRQNLDEAFVRRLAFIVHFPMPDEAHRRRIWESVWPEEVPLSNDVDLDILSCQWKLSGGNIKNIALNAAFLGAPEGLQINAQHVLHATSREHQKLGKKLALPPLSNAG